MLKKIQSLAGPRIAALPRSVRKDIGELGSAAVVSVCAGRVGRSAVLSASAPLRHKLL
jgi:hypothetical protein